MDRNQSVFQTHLKKFSRPAFYFLDGSRSTAAILFNPDSKVASKLNLRVGRKSFDLQHSLSKLLEISGHFWGTPGLPSDKLMPEPILTRVAGSL
jgi:hypothetical protein